MALTANPWLLKPLGLLAGNDAYFTAVITEMGEIDWGTYWRTVLAANRHTAAHVLAAITVPTLITAGDKDRMTPMSIAERMHERIRGSELVVIPGGTHYSHIEFPERFNEAFDRFLDRVPE